MVSNKLVLRTVAVLVVLICLGASTQVDFRFGLKNKPFIDVTDATYGADPTGTNDSTAAINAAIVASVPNGAPAKDVFLPAGTYLVSSLTVSIANVHIRGVSMGSTVIQWNGSGSGKVLNETAGPRLVLTDLTINANGAAYGIYCADQACYQNKMHDVEVYGATGSPGVGIYCLSNCYSQEWRGMRITTNNIGAQFPATSQGTSIIQSKLYGNCQVNLYIGDNNGWVRGFFLVGNDIESGACTGSTQYDIEADGVDPLVINGGYFESSATTDSADLYFTGTELSRVSVNGAYSNANIETVHPIQINSTQVYMDLRNSYYFNGTGTTFDSTTANSSNVQIQNTALADTGCDPCTSPTYIDTRLADLTLTSWLSSPWLNTTRGSGTGNAISMTSVGSKYGAISIGTDTASGGSWCLGSTSTASASATATASYCWDASGHTWEDGNKVWSPPAGITQQGVGHYWYGSPGTAGAYSFYEGDSTGATDTKWWDRTIIHSTGDYRIESVTDNSTAQEVPIELGRNGGVAMNGATVCTNFANCGQVVIQGGMQLNTSGAAPTCAAGTRGEFYVTQGGTGVADTVKVCAKDSSNSYAWRSIY